MSKPCRFHQCLGLGFAATPNGLVCDPDTGRYHLVEAVNLDVVQGRLRRRPGLTRLLALGAHSLFSDGPNLYAGCEDRLYRIPGQGEPRVLRDGLTAGARLAFVAAGDAVYFANGFQTGVIRDGTAFPWSAPAYPGPDRDGRYVPPPAGHLLAHFAGRIWIARNELVFFTEGAGLFDWVDSLAGFLPPTTGRVRLLHPVADGLFLGDDAGVLFAGGSDPKTMTFARVCPVPPVPGSDAALEPGRHDAVAGQALTGQSAIWAGQDGLYLGRPSGHVQRLVAAAFPSAARASAVATTTRYLLALAS
jgi:hypothetical protein